MKKSVALPALSVCFIFAASALCAQSVSTSADLAAAFNNRSSSSITIASDITAADYLNSRASDITLNGSSGILTLNGYKFVFMPNWNDGLSADISNMQIAGATSSGAIELGGDGQGDHNYTISGSNFTNNKNSQNGGAIYSHAQSHGGVRNYVFTGNVFNLNSAANGGALYNASNNSQMPVFFNITDGSFNANSAINGNGGAIYNATNYGSGSGLNNGFTIGTQANKILFTNNSAPIGYGGAIYNFVNNPSSGGTSEINIFGDFQGNSAANGGSVVNHVEGGNGSNSVSVGIGGNFSGNSAGNNGGAVANYVGLSGNAPYGGLNIFDFTYADFTNNAAGTDGGAIYNYFNSGGSSGQVNVGGNGILFSNNGAGRYGGAIYNYANAYSTIPALNIADGTVFSNNKAVLGYAIYNDNLGVININSETSGIKFTGNSNIDINSSARNDIYQASSGGVINITTSGVGQAYFDGGFDGAGTINKYASGAALNPNPTQCADGTLCLAAGSDSSGFKGTFNHYEGQTDVFGTMFGGTNNIKNTGGSSLVNVYSDKNSFYYNANMYLNAMLRHTSLTTDIVSISKASSDSSAGLQFKESGARVLFTNGNADQNASYSLENDISNGQTNRIDFENSNVSFGTADYTGGTIYGFTNSVIDLAKSSSSVKHYKFGEFDVYDTGGSSINIKAIGNGAGSGANYDVDSIEFSLVSSANTLQLGKVYVSNDSTALSGTKQVLFNKSAQNLELALGGSTFVIATSSNIYTLALGTTQTANDSIAFSSVSNTGGQPPEPGKETLVDLNDANALTAAATGKNMTANRGWQIDADSVYYNPNDDGTNGHDNVANGLTDMAAGTFHVYGSLQNDFSAKLSGKFGLNGAGGSRSLFNIVNNDTNFNLSDLTVEEAFIAGGGSVLRLNNSLSAANIDYVLISNNTASGNGGAVSLFVGTLNIKYTDFIGNTATKGGAVNIEGGTLNIQQNLGSQSVYSGFDENYAETGGAIYQSGGAASITDQNFIGNTATKGGGGAIYRTGGAGGGTMNLSATSAWGYVVYNTAQNGGGGAIYNDAAGLTIGGNMGFGYNQAKTAGGAIYNTANGEINFDSTLGNISFVLNEAGGMSNDIYNDGVINFVGTAGVSAFTGGFGGAGAINQNADGNMFGLTDTSDSSAFTGTFKQTAGTTVNQGIFFGGTNTIAGGSLYWAGGAASKVDTSSLSVDKAQLFVRKEANLVLNNAADIINQNAVVAIDGNSKISVQNAGAQLYLGAEDLWYGAVNMTNGAVTLDNLKNTAGSNYAQNGGTLNLINGSVLTLGENSAISDGNITISSSTLNQNAIAVNLSGAGNAGWGNLSLTDARINAMDGVITENNFAGEMEITGAANFDIDLDPANRISDRYIFDGAVKNSGLATINVDFFRLVSTPAEEEIPFQIFEGSSISGVDFTTSTPRVMTAVGAYDFGPIAGRDGWYLLNMVPGVFNPNTPRGPASVLAMLSAQLLANNVLFDHVFFDSNVMLSSENKCDYRFIPSQFLKENRQSNIWLKTYYETGGLPLDGFNLKTDMYGYMMGIDLPAKDMSADAYFLPTFYGGYTGAKETFAQTDMKQNALQAGFMASFMKNAYTAAGLIYGGVYHNHMNVEGFKDDVYNWFAGMAVKNSYNIYLDNLVVQPSLLGSYNFYGKQKWDSSYGDITMQSDYMNGFNVAPGINFIYGLKTWNFMLSGLYMINMGGAISGKAGNIDLPKVDRGSDYLEYGAGISKIFSQKFNVWAKAIFKTNRDSDFGVRAAAQWRF